MKLLLKLLFTVTLFLSLVNLNTHLLFQSSWLKFEYNRSGFPLDEFGLSNQERFEAGTLGLRFVKNQLSIEELTEYKTSDQSWFNQREIDHLIDVRTVYVWVTRLGMISTFGLMVSLILLHKQIQELIVFSFRSLMMLSIAVGLSVSFAWSLAFEAFHQLLFKPGTWSFYIDDLLIRLYPEQLWLDSTIVFLALFLLEMTSLVILNPTISRVKNLARRTPARSS